MIFASAGIPPLYRLGSRIKRAAQAPGTPAGR
jgi:hypothetical protein